MEKEGEPGDQIWKSAEATNEPGSLCSPRQPSETARPWHWLPSVGTVLARAAGLEGWGERRRVYRQLVPTGLAGVHELRLSRAGGRGDRDRVWGFAR